MSSPHLIYLQNNYLVEWAKDEPTIEAALKLRYQVFCIEEGVIPSIEGSLLERDQHDADAHHIILKERATGEVVGTVRLLTEGEGLPMRAACGPLMDEFPLQTMGEVSRFSLFGTSSAGLYRLGLLRGIYRVSLQLGLTHWCAMMEPRLLRLLNATGIKFNPLGPMVEAYGPRQPSTASVAESVNYIRDRRPEYFDYVIRPLEDEL